ncbi:MAG: Asp-tRNA(Asn)/Glu-tRNA(Gln) amidotransferase subunit GatA [Proteobacteria bacterium]|nr:Asp-tRNA(Asn)/Glu-tRNA(Gln) amidotransferase subunit GatA [Pseudomonadota bacterium]
MTDLSFNSISELRSGLDSGAFSSVELTEQLLAKIERHKDLGAFVEISRAHALAQAAAADKRIQAKESSPLLGIPVAIKDMILTKGIRTTAASKMLSTFIPPYDATVTRKLAAAGSVMIGKTNLDEFAMGSSNETSHFGVVRNPWNQAYVPGGSSGGSACAVAAGLAPAALGTDTGGSIRQPAGFCNLVGIKPTYGRVSRYGAIAFASSLDQIGPFARNTYDAALLTEVLSGHDELDSTSVQRPVPSFTAATRRGVQGLRIGIPKEYFIKGLHPEVEAAIQTALKKLQELGASIVEISLPHTELAVAVYYVLAPAEASSNLARYDGVRYGYRTVEASSLEELYARSRSEGFGSEVKRRILVGSYVLSAGYFDAYYRKAQKVRALIAKDFTSAFASVCDVIACPTSPTPPFRIGEKTDDPIAMYLSDVFTIPLNLAGLPGLSLPCGFDSLGLPIGLQLIGKAWDEESIFAAASAYESATEWHKRWPAIV